MALFTRPAAPTRLRSWRSAKTAFSRVFQFQCAYCETTEYSGGSYRSFQVDHFRPKSKAEFRILEHAWENLYYACPDCNSLKKDFWPSEGQTEIGYTLIDPCREDPFVHVGVDQDGVPRALNSHGRCIIEVFGFDIRPELQRRWVWRDRLIREIAEVEDALAKAQQRPAASAVIDAKLLAQRLNKLTGMYKLCFLGWDTRPTGKRLWPGRPQSTTR